MIVEARHAGTASTAREVPAAEVLQRASASVNHEAFCDTAKKIKQAAIKKLRGEDPEKENAKKLEEKNKGPRPNIPGKDDKTVRKFMGALC